MANEYYDNSDPAQRFQPGTTVRANEVDGKLDKVAAGFDAISVDKNRALKLPSVDGVSQEITATALERRRHVIGFDAEGKLTLFGNFLDSATEARDDAIDARDAAQLSEKNAADSEDEAQRIEQYLFGVAQNKAEFTGISWHEQVISSDVNMPENKNGWSFGPAISVAQGATVTIGSNAFWTIANGAQQ